MKYLVFLLIILVALLPPSMGADSGSALGASDSIAQDTAAFDSDDGQRMLGKGKGKGKVRV